MKLPWLLRLLQRVEFPNKLGLCQKLFAKQLSSCGTCWVETAPGPVWKLDLTNSTHRWIVYGYYEGPEFFRWLDRNLFRDGSIIVDSGANIGQMILYFGSYFTSAKIFAFEPGAFAVEWLRDCLEANPGINPEVVQKGLSDTAQTLFFQEVGLPNSRGSQNTVTQNETGDKIEVVRLDDFLEERGVDHVDVWKLDVEGTELAALSGASRLLERKKVGAIWVETFGENGIRITQWLRDKGYSPYAVRNSGDAVAISTPASDQTLFLPD